MNLLTRRQLLVIATALLTTTSMELAAIQNVLPRDLFKNINIDRKALERLIFKTYKSLNIEKIKKYLNLKIENDFIKENIVTIDSWVLSRTEARLWCLLHVMLV
jgi:hypothetical protein